MKNPFVRWGISVAAIVLILTVPMVGAEALKSKADRKRDRYHWYEMSDAQEAKFKAAIAAVLPEDRRLVIILCDAATDCKDLAQDIDTVLDEAGWTSEIDRPGETVNGLHCTVAWFCKLLTDATGIHVVVDDDDQPAIVLNFGRKGR